VHYVSQVDNTSERRLFSPQRKCVYKNPRTSSVCRYPYSPHMNIYHKKVIPQVPSSNRSSTSSRRNICHSNVNVVRFYILPFSFLTYFPHLCVAVAVFVGCWYYIYKSNVTRPLCFLRKTFIVTKREEERKNKEVRVHFGFCKMQRVFQLFHTMHSPLFGETLLMFSRRCIQHREHQPVTRCHYDTFSRPFSTLLLLLLLLVRGLRRTVPLFAAFLFLFSDPI
jgi:hypothetical protein